MTAISARPRRNVARGAASLNLQLRGCATPGAPYYAPLVNIGSTQGASAAWAINENSEVIGAASANPSLTLSASARPCVGFRWTQADGTFLVPHPAGRAIFPRGVNDSGVIVGTAVDNATPSIGQVFRFDPTVDAGPQFIQIPTGIGTAINAAGQITGHGYFATGHSMFRPPATPSNPLQRRGPATIRSLPASTTMAAWLDTPYDPPVSPPPSATRTRLGSNT